MSKSRPVPTKKRAEAQPFEVAEVRRSEIKLDPANPRQMDEYARKRLGRGLDRYGLLLPILVNRRTRMVVSGHQRLAWLDKKKKGQDYALKVAWCDLSEKAAREAALLLNNPGAMGEWDIEKLELVLTEEPLDVESAGFDRMDFELLFPESEKIADKYGRVFGEAPESVKDNIAKAGETGRISREQRAQGNDKVASDRDSERHVTAVFASRKRKNEFLRRVGILSDERYLDGERLMAFVEKKRAGAKPAPKGGKP
jgi:hypothetical protein